MSLDTVGVARRRALAGVPIAVLAREYGISRQAMRKAVYGVTYKDCPIRPLLDPGGDYVHPNRRLTDCEVVTLRRDRSSGMTWRAVASKYGISVSTARQVFNREHYKGVA